MSTVTVSPKYQVVIPQMVREGLHLRPGQKLDVFLHDGRIEMIPVRHPREMRGFLAGIDTTIERDPDRL
ncbi:MAG TPA: AbrB/MazE/SpoVT family DNA-binding domain-containing protein [Longimicrobiaceae bacterium]|nr:AbrB/MazE/SpoVT family DNA-binding domain-containing protein [Longimicrobiaceae bacterium]